MTGLSNFDPADASGVQGGTGRTPTDAQLHQPSGNPAALAAAPPPNEIPPAIGGGDLDDVYEMSEEDFRQELFKENHSMPLFVLGIGTLACLAIAAGKGFIDGGFEGALGMSLVGALLFVFALITGTMAAFVTGKMFGSDFGSFGSLVIRVGALTAAHFLIFMGMGTFLDPAFILLLSLPVTLGLAIWILGMGAVQALLFSLMMGAIAIISLTVVLVSLTTMIGSGSAGV